MFLSLKPYLFVIVAFSLLLFPASAWSASPIKAKAVLVEGEATVFPIVDSKSYAIVIGTKFREGDRIKTSENGVVEIEFDTGDLIRIDKSTDMVIKALHRNKKGSTTSIFSLLVGRVKSAVTKLVDDESKFEYHTKAAIAGVAGTPPFIVGFVGGIANIDLLGETGDKGKVFVQGTDSARSRVDISPGFRTTVNIGFAPKDAFKISTQRLNNFNRTIPFINKPKRTALKTRPAAITPPTDQGDKPDDEHNDKPAETAQADTGTDTGATESDNASAGNDGVVTGDDKPKDQPEIAPRHTGAPPHASIEESMVINTINRNVSKPKQTSPSEAQGVEAVENQSTTSQGIIGQSTESSGDDQPPINTTTIDIFIKLK